MNSETSDHGDLDKIKALFLCPTHNNDLAKHVFEDMLEHNFQAKLPEERLL